MLTVLFIKFPLGFCIFYLVLLRGMESDWYLNGCMGEGFGLLN